VIHEGGPGSAEESGDQDALYGHGAEAPSWIDYLDRLALKMGFVSYDIKGTYRGYSSQEPSFPDNFITFNAEAYRAFLALPLAEQERRLLDTLVRDNSYSYNEFYTVSIHGRLDRFPSWGCGVGVMRGLNFAAIRRFLLDLLQGCEPGTWYSTSDLVTYLKAHHPFFLIPQQLEKNKQLNTVEKRYGNFYENDQLYSRTPIPDDAPDGFERVEGRYVERFLEGLPLSLGYVDVAYGDRPAAASTPSRGRLRAFRINERFLQAMRGDMPQPKVIIQPNFEIYIESAFYPASLISRLAPLADVIREDTTTILKLQKQKVAAQLAEQADLDVIALLKDVSGQDLPQNVAVELQEWAGHADVFTLYDGFGLVESVDDHAAADGFTAETIGASLRLVRHPDALFARLMESGTIALRIRHGDTAWAALPAQAHTVFPRHVPAAQSPKQKTKQAVTLKRETLIALHFPDDGLFEDFRKALLDARCVLDVNRERRTLTLSGNDEAQIKQVIKRLSGAYAIRVEDLA